MPLQDYEDVDSIKIPGGIYFTTLYSGHEEGVVDHIKDTKKELEREGYRIIGDIIQIVQIDLSVTGYLDSIIRNSNSS